MKVSVLVMTYNHAPFIRRCLDSVLMQRLEGGYELLISEDCSTDGTREIVKEYQREHPARVRLLLSEKNLRSNAIVVRGIDAARGEYIALLDGDDYWTDPEKLRRQVTFLDRHTDCSICFHNAQVIHDDGSRPPWNWTPANHPEITTIEELFQGNYIATCSTMFRRGIIGPIPKWYDEFFPITDWPLHLLNAEQGHIGYINEVMGVYRYHAGGYYSSLSQEEKFRVMLDFYRRIDTRMEGRHHRLIQTAISKYFIEWAEEYLRQGDTPRARNCFSKCLAGRVPNRHVRWRRVFSVGAACYLPRIPWLRRLWSFCRRNCRSRLAGASVERRAMGSAGVKRSD